MDTLRIGEALARARARRGLDIRAAEELTKIRARYLRALEAEDWEALPGPAYARGFLRTYASALGLDADALLDAYRRQVEAHAKPRPITPLAEPVLERHVPLAERERRRRRPLAWLAALAAAAAIAAAAVAVVAAIGGGERGAQRHHHRVAAHRKERHPRQRAHPAAGGKPVALKLVPRNAVVACLVRGGSEALIDDQALDPGAPQGPFQPARRFRLDLETGGAVKLVVDGRPRIVRSRRKASWVISSAGVAPVDFAGPRCP